MREERRGGGALLFTSYKRNCVFEFSGGIFRQIFAIFSKIDRTKRRSSVHGRIRGRMDGRGKVASSLDGLWALPMHRA